MIDMNEMNAPLPDSRSFGLSLDAFHRLVLIDADGHRHIGVEPIRAYPLAEPTKYVSIVDALGREIAFVPTLDQLAPETRALLERELKMREFLPVITKIMAISGDGSAGDWDVETDHGRTKFSIEDEEEIRRMGPFKVLITDTTGVRYLINDTRALSASSRRLLDKYL